MNPAARDRLRDRIMYLHATIRDLKNIAESERCDTLAYLLEMAYVESGDILRGTNVRPGMGKMRKA